MPDITVRMESAEGRSTRRIGTRGCAPGDAHQLGALLTAEIQAFREYLGEPKKIELKVQDFGDQHTTTGYGPVPREG